MPATLAAVLLTATGFVAVLMANAPLVRLSFDSADDREIVRAERIAFVSPRIAPVPVPRADAAITRSSAPVSGRDVRDVPILPTQRSADTIARLDVSPAPAPAVVPVPSLLPTPGTPRGLRPAPFTVPQVHNPFAPTLLSRREQDSVGRELGLSIPLLARDRKMTSTERDALMRVASSAAAIPGRPAQIPGTLGVSLPLPLFSPGPSPAERRRDSIGNAEYVARLRRLQERARLRNDSVRIADSSSRRGVPE